MRKAVAITVPTDEGLDKKTVISSQQKEEKWLMIALSDDERQCTSDEVS